MLDTLYKVLQLYAPEFGWACFAAFVASIFLDVSKIPVNPWKWFLRNVSKIFNADVITSQKQMEDNLRSTCQALQEKHTQLAEKIDAVEYKQLVWQKRTSRRKIIEFADECRRGVQHSSQRFLNAFDDINEYEQLCRETDDPNHVVDESVRYITEIYQKRLEKNDFI